MSMVGSAPKQMPPRDCSGPDGARGHRAAKADELAFPPLQPGSADAFRQAWRGIGSTVTLVATEHRGVAHAMLATAVSSVSMDPPSLLACVNRSASAHEALRGRGAFSLGIMGRDGQHIAAAIAQAPAGNRFSQGTWRRLRRHEGPIDDLPWLAEAQATLFCVTDECLEYGTHSVLIARIAGVIDAGSPDPLLYCDGSYGRFARQSA